MYCSDHRLVGIAAPRKHAKSTALTHDFVLANVCFQVESHVLVVSATEELALAHLGDIAVELRDNDELRQTFGIKTFQTDSKSEIVVVCNPSKDYPLGYTFRIIARGAGQKLRGLKWRGRRPGLIICDDMEEDEQVENYDQLAIKAAELGAKCLGFGQPQPTVIAPPEDHLERIADRLIALQRGLGHSTPITIDGQAETVAA